MRSKFLPYLIGLLVVAIVLAGCNEGKGQGRGGDNRKPQATKESQSDVIIGGPIVWKADFESGDLSQYRDKVTKGNPMTKADSGKCTRTNNGVSNEQAHSGNFSMKMTIDSTRDAGCRQFRKEEVASGNAFYYSAWYYIPVLTHVDVFWNIFQFKANLNGNSEVFWKLEIRNNSAGDMVIVPVWKGNVPGPRAKDGELPNGNEGKLFFQTKTTVPVGKWFHLEVFLKQSEQFDGHIIVWQDGIELLNMDNVRTKSPGSVQNWSVNNYGRGLTPNPTTLYIDDVVVSTKRVGP